jgi:hypothetical protein
MNVSAAAPGVYTLLTCEHKVWLRSRRWPPDAICAPGSSRRFNRIETGYLPNISRHPWAHGRRDRFFPSRSASRIARGPSLPSSSSHTGKNEPRTFTDARGRRGLRFPLLRKPAGFFFSGLRDDPGTQGSPNSSTRVDYGGMGRDRASWDLGQGEGEASDIEVLGQLPGLS